MSLDAAALRCLACSCSRCFVTCLSDDVLVMKKNPPGGSWESWEGWQSWEGWETGREELAKLAKLAKLGERSYWETGGQLSGIR